jgi:hypothetical protein
MAKQARKAMQDETRVSITLIERINLCWDDPDMLDDVIIPWIRDKLRPGYFRFTMHFVPDHPDIDYTREDFDFYFSDPNTALEFKLRWG